MNTSEVKSRLAYSSWNGKTWEIVGRNFFFFFHFNTLILNFSKNKKISENILVT